LELDGTKEIYALNMHLNALNALFFQLCTEIPQAKIKNHIDIRKMS